MSGNTRILSVRGGLLLGGLVCLALAAPPAARAGKPRPEPSPEAMVHALEKAVRAADDKAIAALLADTPDDRGREELLAFFAAHRAAGLLEYTLFEMFGPGQAVEMKTWWKDARIEIVRKTVICEVPVLQLRASWKEEDGSPTTRELPAYVDPDGTGIVLQEGFFGLSEDDSRVVADLSRYQAKLYEKTTDEVSGGKYDTREQIIQALKDDLGQSEPFRRYVTQVAGPAVARAAAMAIDKALKEVLQKAAQEAAIKEKLIGSWEMPDVPDGPVWSFGKDGEATLVGTEDVLTGHDVPRYRYALDGNKLKLIPADGSAAGEKAYTIAELTDTVLVLVDADGDRTELHRI